MASALNQTYFLVFEMVGIGQSEIWRGDEEEEEVFSTSIIRRVPKNNRKHSSSKEEEVWWVYNINSSLTLPLIKALFYVMGVSSREV